MCKFTVIFLKIGPPSKISLNEVIAARGTSAFLLKLHPPIYAVVNLVMVMLNYWDRRHVLLLHKQDMPDKRGTAEHWMHASIVLDYLYVS